MKTKVKGTSRNPLNDSEKKYIREYHSTTPVLTMSKNMKRTPALLYSFMDQEGLEVFRLKPGKERHSGKYFQFTDRLFI